jgi:lipoate-protein ligase B
MIGNRYFTKIIPCGIQDKDKGVASLSQFIPSVTLDDGNIFI